MIETTYGRPSGEANPDTVSPSLVVWTGIHGDETHQSRLLTEYFMQEQTGLPAVVLTDLHAEAAETGTRGALLVGDHGYGTMQPGVEYVWVRHDRSGGIRHVSRKQPTHNLHQWAYRPMLDMNRMAKAPPDGLTLHAHADVLHEGNPRDPRIPLFRRMADYPHGLIVSVHEDLERRAKPVGKFRPDGMYVYITATRDRIDALKPILYGAMKRVRSAGYAVFRGQDDPQLRMHARDGIIEDVVDDTTPPDSTLEKWFALASHRGMTADGQRTLRYPVIYTIEFPGKASEPEKKDLISIMMNGLIKPTWSHLFPSEIQ